MRQLFPSPAEFRELFALATPVAVVQLGLMLMGVVDTMMVGRFSPDALGAVALGNLVFWTLSIAGVGTLMALDPVIAQAVGAKDEPAIARGLQRGLILAGWVTIPTALALALVKPMLRAMGQPPELIPDASRFIYLSLPGLLPYYVFIVFRQTLQALGRIAPIVWVTLLANLLNAGLDWLLIFGRLGAPRWGVAGSAIATSVSRTTLAVALLFAGWRELRPRLRPWLREASDRLALLRMARLGIPIGFQMFLEYGVFAAVGVLMGRIGTLAIDGHQIALNLSAVVFMVPQGVGAAAAVLVGRAVGAEDLPRARRAALGALVLGGGFMIGSAAVFVTAPGFLARLYTPDRAVIAVAASLIVLGGLFAIFDGLQAVSIGILRGTGDTRAPMILSLLGYWLVGLPVSVLLGFRAGLGPEGLWWGLVVGLAVTAVVLLARVRAHLRQAVRRIQIDQPKPVSGDLET